MGEDGVGNNAGLCTRLNWLHFLHLLRTCACTRTRTNTHTYTHHHHHHHPPHRDIQKQNKRQVGIQADKE